MNEPVRSTRQGVCGICKKKIYRAVLIRKLAIGWVHESCWEKIKR